MNNKKKILFLGYDDKQTCLLQAIKAQGYILEHTSEKINSLSSFDKVISFGYRHILSKEILQTSKSPVVNLHIAYLPYNRGAHPNFWCFYDNTPSGVTIHEIDEGIDTGPIIYQKYVNFDENEDTFAKTYRRLVTEIENFFIDKMHSIMNGNYVSFPQRGKATYHSVADLPKFITTWGINIQETIYNITHHVGKNYSDELELIEQIQNIRGKNNVNWMDLLKLAFKNDPKETKKLLRKINDADNEISHLFKTLSHNEINDEKQSMEAILPVEGEQIV